VIGVGAALALAFVRRQRTLARPMIDLRLFDDRAFTSALLAYALGTFVAFGIFVFVAQYLQLVLGMDPLTAGLWTLPSSLGFIAGSFIVPLAARRLGTVPVMTGGLLMSVLGFVLLVFVGTADLGLLVTGSVIFSVGLTPVVALTTDLVVSSAPPERAGSASSLSETSTELGGALGIAVLGSLAAAVYRTSMTGRIPAGLDAAATEAARGTIGGAMATAGQLPAAAGAGLLQAAREAYVLGMQASTALSAVIMLGTAVMAVVLLRGHADNRRV